MRNRKIAVNAIVVLLTLAIFSSVAFAEAGQVSDETMARVVQMVEKTNRLVEQDVLRAQQLANVVLRVFGDNDFSAAIISVIIDQLEAITYHRVQLTIQRAAELGVAVGCEIEEVVVGGQIAMIDPAFVMSD